MPNKKDLKLDKYNISKYRYRELRNWCLQYHDWLYFVTTNNNDAVKSPVVTGLPSSGGFNNPTAVLAEKIAQFKLNIELVKSIVKKVTDNYADGAKSFYDAMLMTVTDEGVTYEFLYTRGLIYHSKYIFSEARKHFYFLLDKEKN